MTQFITANPGGGQTNATPITEVVAVVNVSAHVNDSVLLPPAIAEADILVYQAAANAVAVFPSPGDTIAHGFPAGPNGPKSIGSGVLLRCLCFVAGTWNLFMWQSL